MDSETDKSIYYISPDKRDDPVEHRIQTIMKFANCNREKAGKLSSKIRDINHAIFIAKYDMEIENIIKDHECNRETAIKIWRDQKTPQLDKKPFG